MKTAKIILLAAAAILSAACTSKPQKDKSLWICDDANFKRLSTKDSICFYLDKAAQTGFNRVVVDVKGASGLTLYESAFIPSRTREGGFELGEREWDYLGYFIEQAHDRKIKVTVAMTPFSVGCPMIGEGPCYSNPELKEHTCVEYNPSGFLKIEDDPAEVSAFLNPSDPFAIDYGMRTIREIVEKYDVDGLCLDYCRYPGMKSDFSDLSRRQFEEYIGEKVQNFPADVFSYGKKGEIIPGKYYRQWWTWRSGNIKSFISGVRAYLKSVKPEVELEYWAASWLHVLYKNGQNWASDRSEYYRGLDWAEDGYCRTGFAGELDLFVSGTYLERVWGMEDLESIEYGLYRTKRDVAGACRVQGSLYAVNHLDQFEDAVYLCMKETSGVMVFDLVWIVKNDLWDEIKAGIDRAEKGK